MALFAKTPSSVDEIMSNFTTTIAKLRGMAELNASRSADIEETISELESEQEALVHEATRAREVAGRLENLLNLG